ncbi:unnamed protein product [Cylindrotheca closterium]|uniref:Uncharacterized protein n=1 Tax=Cylindrotheca closterium TaxID=2856 RepID=A0AAD2PUV0_9STRA|nr:unnamed protein product [Cylindrotheca closterium]
MTLSTESAVKLLGDVIDIAMADFEFENGPIDFVSESVQQSEAEAEQNCVGKVEVNLDMAVEDILKIARERRIRKQGNRRIGNDVDNDIDSLHCVRSCMRTSFNSDESSSEDEEDFDEEFELPLNDCVEVKSSKDTSMKRTSLTSLLQATL